MNAADSIQALEQRAATSRAIRIATLILLAVAAIAAFAYIIGKTKGAADTRQHLADSTRAVQADSSEAKEERIATRAPAIARADSQVVKTRVARQAVAKRITIVDDSTVRVDSGPPEREVPASLVVPELRTCASADSAAVVDLSLVRAQLTDMTGDRDTWRDRALNDEANAPHIPLLGFKSGLAAGVVIVVAILHFVRF